MYHRTGSAASLVVFACDLCLWRNHRNRSSPSVGRDLRFDTEVRVERRTRPVGCNVYRNNRIYGLCHLWRRISKRRSLERNANSHAVRRDSRRSFVAPVCRSSNDSHSTSVVYTAGSISQSSVQRHRRTHRRLFSLGRVAFDHS